MVRPEKELIMVRPKKRWRNCQELALPPMEWPGSGVLGHSAHFFVFLTLPLLEEDFFVIFFSVSTREYSRKRVINPIPGWNTRQHLLHSEKFTRYQPEKSTDKEKANKFSTDKTGKFLDQQMVARQQHASRKVNSQVGSDQRPFNCQERWAAAYFWHERVPWERK